MVNSIKAGGCSGSELLLEQEVCPASPANPSSTGLKCLSQLVLPPWLCPIRTEERSQGWIFPFSVQFPAQKTFSGRILTWSQRKSLFFFLFLSLFYSTFLLISSGTYSWSCHRAPLANILQGFVELHHLASEEQLSGNTFGFAHAAPAPHSLPVSMGTEQGVRWSQGPAPEHEIPQTSCPMGTEPPKPSRIHLQRVQSIPGAGGSAGAGC